MAKSRGNGEGTFIKESTGKWRLRKFVRDPVSGEFVRKSFTAATQQKCKEKAKEYENGETEIDNSMSVINWLEEWAKVYIQPRVDPSTYDSYLSDFKIIKKDTIAAFGINSVKPIHAQEFFNRNNKKSLSTLKKLRYYLNAAFNTALDNGLVLSNPFARVSVASKAPKKERLPFSDDEVKKIAEFSSGNEFELAIIFMLRFGLRSGELRGLRWTDIDLINGLVHLDGALNKYDDRINSVGNKNHVRNIPIPPGETFSLIKRKYSSGYVLTGANYPMSKNSFRSKYDTFFRRLNIWCTDNEQTPIRTFSPHSMRHTYATLLYKKGVDKFTRMALLGHKSEDVNFTYTHSEDDVSKQAINMVFGA